MNKLTFFLFGGAIIAVLGVIIFLAVFLTKPDPEPVGLILGEEYSSVASIIDGETIIEVSVDGDQIPETLLYKYSFDGTIPDAFDESDEAYTEAEVDGGFIQTSFSTQEFSGGSAVLIVTDGIFIYTVDVTDAVPEEDIEDGTEPIDEDTEPIEEA